MSESGRIVGRGVGYGALSGFLFAETVLVALAVASVIMDGGEDPTTSGFYVFFVASAIFAAVVGVVPGLVVGLLSGVVFALSAPNLVGRPGRVRLAGLLVGPGLNVPLVPWIFLSDAWWVPLGVIVGMGLLGMWFAPRVLYGRPAGEAG
ncbi:hypothetical protein [Spirillospora sp. CA-294931]|uniref:hypothetical protein n=1 Tax=Spirillospora sp. CA-294931 TaxID=3240042 RepID=UPI003D8A013F